MKKSKFIPIITSTAILATALPLSAMVSCSDNQSTIVKIEVDSPNNSNYASTTDTIKLYEDMTTVIDVVCNESLANLPFFMGTSQILATDANGNTLTNLIMLRDFTYQRVNADTNQTNESNGNALRIVIRRQTIKKIIKLHVFKLIIKMGEVKKIPIKFVAAQPESIHWPAQAIPTQISKNEDLVIENWGYDAPFNHLQFRDGDEPLLAYDDEIVVTKSSTNSNFINLRIKKSLIRRIKKGLFCIVSPWTIDPYAEGIDTKFDVELDEESAKNFELIDETEGKGSYKDGYTGFIKAKDANSELKPIQCAIATLVRGNDQPEQLLKNLDYTLEPEIGIVPGYRIAIPRHTISSGTKISIRQTIYHIKEALSFMKKDISGDDVKELIHVSSYGEFEPGQDFNMVIWPTVKAMFLHHINVEQDMNESNIEIKAYQNELEISGPGKIYIEPIRGSALAVTIKKEATATFIDNDIFNLLIQPKNFI